MYHDFVCFFFDSTRSVLRKRISVMTNCPWLRDLGQTMDPERRLRLLDLQQRKSIRIVRRYKDRWFLVEIYVEIAVR